MRRPTDEELLAFLEGELDAPGRERVLSAIEADPSLAAELRAAAAGHAAARLLRAPHSSAPVAPVLPGGKGMSPWWIAAAAAATLALAVPATLWFSSRSREAPAGTAASPEPGYVLVLQGRWPDAATVLPDERQRRADEYWAWTDSLARESVLIAAGDFRWEPGFRLGPNGVQLSVSQDVVESPDFLVGMLALRVTSYEEALAISSKCPHLRYGGSVSVRSVARGFLTARSGPTLSGAPTRGGDVTLGMPALVSR